MVSYKDNPNVRIKTVTTVTGDKEYRKNCKYIKGKYYTIEKDCFNIDGRWIRKDSGYIEYDHELEQWVLKAKTKALTHGIVGFKGGEPVMGYFSPNIYNNCIVRTKYDKVHCINPDLLLKNGYFEDISSSQFYSSKDVNDAVKKKLMSIRNEHDFTRKGYNIEENGKEFEDKKRHHKQYEPKLSKACRSFARFLGDTSFGAEVETSAGNMPAWLQNRYGLVACRDGSINSAEWVTVPLSGAKGLYTLAETGKEISARCNIDINC